MQFLFGQYLSIVYLVSLQDEKKAHEQNVHEIQVVRAHVTATAAVFKEKSECTFCYTWIHTESTVHAVEHVDDYKYYLEYSIVDVVAQLGILDVYVT